LLDFFVKRNVFGRKLIAGPSHLPRFQRNAIHEIGGFRMQRRIPAVMMRGGTSKGIFFKKNHLPADPDIRDRVILAAYGSPDPYKRQINGLGGATSTTSKTAIISLSDDLAYDIVYNFGQVSIDRPIIDFKGNCGNISSAVGPYAVDEGLVPVVAPVPSIRTHQFNTDKLIIADVPVRDGRYDESGDFEIPGIPGTGGKITLRFMDPGGSLTGRLLPTGQPRDRLTGIPELGDVDVTILDASNPCVFLRAEDLGLKGHEIEEIEKTPDIKAKLEAVRARVAVMLGFVETSEEATARCQAVPKIGCVATPRNYVSLSGQPVVAEDMDLCGRMMSMGVLHQSFPVSAAISLSGAAKIEHTVAHDCLAAPLDPSGDVRLGHPGGVLPVGSTMEYDSGRWHYAEAVIYRTARRLMEGYVLVPENCFS
jgi:2-methylaconitate cis-trans-isomerase PrpF